RRSFPAQRLYALTSADHHGARAGHRRSRGGAHPDRLLYWWCDVRAILTRLSDIVGRRKILLIMLSVMALGGVIAALAPNIGVLMFARALQGIAGPTIPMTLIILRSQVKNEVRLGTLLGLVAAINGGV